MRDHQVPAVPDHVEHVALIVRAGHVGREKVAGHGVMATGAEGVTDGPAVFASDQDAH